ncbi:MAG: pullulanase-associated domain-containing protein [Treponema sp.]
MLVVSFGFIACSNDSSDTENSGNNLLVAPEAIPNGYIRINYVGSGDWNLWVWKDFDDSESKKCESWPKGIKVMYQNGSNICWDLKLKDNPSVLGFIVVNDNEIKGSGNSDLFFYFPKRYNEIFINNKGEIFINKELTEKPVGLAGATLTSETKISLLGSGLTLSNDTVKIIDKNGSTLAVSNFETDDKGKMTVTLESSVKTTYETISPLSIAVKIDENQTDEVQIGIDSSLIETWFALNAVNAAADMGITISNTTASFKMWSPIATTVELVLFGDVTAVKNKVSNSVIPMEKKENGFWTLNDVDVSNSKYYKYRISTGAISYDVSDIWSHVASANSEASQIISIDDVECKPFDWESTYINPWEGTKYTDSVIYEMHIRDWAKAIGKDGKFIDLAESEEFINHLKDIGITHIQILPSFDYAEKNEDSEYNWGYNPYHYNVPEGRYVKDMKDGSDAVKQFRQFIKAIHDAGIAVNMDVVYNHTNGTQTGSLYDMTIPEYFYRMKDGSYSNGSGCGNEIATNHKMVKYYVIESLKHWMKDYHINGFRFDLMGLHETSTMKEIYNELVKIDPNVMVYGEPWTGGTSAVLSGVTKNSIDSCCDSTTSNGVACFNDDIRNAMKGAEFGGFKPGHVQGVYADDAINVGLMGSLKSKTSGTKKGFTNVLGRSINYAECHDNYTLFDKLAISYLGKESYTGNLFNAIGAKGLEEVKKQNKLVAAYIFLAQGTPFINGGQEFMRTKQGDENSYKSSDVINGIDLTFKEKYSDVYNVYKGLIALRKANPSAFGSNTSAKAETVSIGVTKYTTGDFLVYFNATDAEAAISSSGYTKVIDVTSGTPAESGIIPSKVLAKSFVILKK